MHASSPWNESDPAGKMGQFQDLSQSHPPRGYRGRSDAFTQLWWIVQALLVQTTPQIMYGWRRFVWRLFGAAVGKGVRIRPSVRVTYPWKVEIGDYCQIGDRVELYSLDLIKIGRNVVVSQDSYLCTGTHDYGNIIFPLVLAPIVIEDEVWVAADSFVAPGVTIGRGSIIGARSLVLSNIPPAKIAAGHPARIIKDREKSEGDSKT